MNEKYIAPEEEQAMALMNEEHGDKWQACPFRKGFEYSLQGVTDETRIKLHATLACFNGCTDEQILKCGKLIIEKKLSIQEVLNGEWVRSSLPIIE